MFAGLCLLLCGVIGKFGAILAMCPEPVLGGLAIANFGMVVSIGMSSLQHCDTNSVRNLMILGMSFMMGMVVPYHLKTNPGAINTGTNYEIFLNLSIREYFKLCQSSLTAKLHCTALHSFNVLHFNTLHYNTLHIDPPE